MKYGERKIAKSKLETWNNPFTDKNYLIEITFPEFTCLCPRSGYPDFAVIKIKYVPEKKIIELRSLKYFLNKFRNEYISHEAVTNKIHNTLKKILKPRKLEVTGDFNPRGNIKTIIRVGDKFE